MTKNKNIPEGYMTVGQVAKKMGITVRTLQYYDKEGLFSPTAESEGGRRLYTDKDLIKLHQILSLKSLGFSLSDIKQKLIPLENPNDVAKMISLQAEDVEQKISKLTKSLEEIKKLKEEVLQMQTVDFKKYADIIVNLQLENEYYFLIKYFDEDILDHIRDKFDAQSGRAFIEKFMSLSEKIMDLKNREVPQDSDESQILAEEFWNMVVEFTGGNMEMLPKLMEVGTSGEKWQETQAVVNEYIGPALEIYFSRQGIDPFKEEE